MAVLSSSSSSSSGRAGRGGGTGGRKRAASSSGSCCVVGQGARERERENGAESWRLPRAVRSSSSEAGDYDVVLSPLLILMVMLVVVSTVEQLSSMMIVVVEPHTGSPSVCVGTQVAETEHTEAAAVVGAPQALWFFLFSVYLQTKPSPDARARSSGSQLPLYTTLAKISTRNCILRNRNAERVRERTGEK